MSSKIRVALVGLSAIQSLNPIWANVAHIHVLKNNPHYELIALVNTSVESGEAARKFHGLDSSIKIYDDIKKAAADPEVDLIVISVNVVKHYALAKTAINGGKDVYVEWPLGTTVDEAIELSDLAKTKGVKTFVGIQERVSLAISKMKELIDSGKIGKVLNTTINGNLGFEPGPISQRIKYFFDSKTGGNLLTISFAHLVDGVFHIFGEPTNFQSLLFQGFPPSDVLDEKGNVIEKDFHKTTADQISFQGMLPNDVVISLHIGAGKSMDGGLRWYIYGTKGEIEIKSDNIHFAFFPEAVKIRVRVGDVIEEYPVTKPKNYPEHITGIPIDIYTLYEEFRKGDTTKYPTFEDAVNRQKFIDEVSKRNLNNK